MIILLWGLVLSKHHGKFEKSFQTDILVNGKRLSLNHFIQETVANLVVGLLKSLKEVDKTENLIEIRIEKMDKTKSVDAHKYLQD